MTWILSYPTRGAYNHDEPEVAPETSPVPWEKDQILAARLAADAILRSAAVGTESYDYSIVLSGHGNRDHKPTEEGGVAGEADTITVTITQLTAADLAAAEAAAEVAAEAAAAKSR